MSDFNTNKKINFLPLPYIGLYDLDLIYQTSDVELLYQIISKVNEIAQSQNIIIDNFEKILDWAKNQIEQYTKEQLQEWLDDGTLENLISGIIRPNYITTEGDFEKFKDSTTWILANDIEITKPIPYLKNKLFNLNGYTITLSSSYSGAYVIEIDNNTINDINGIFNGRIDINSTNAYVYLIGYAWNIHTHDVIIVNSKKGFFSYKDSSTSRGAQSVFTNITIIRVVEDNADTGYNLQFNDCNLKNLIAVFFSIGISTKSRGNVTLTECHVWGYPSTYNGGQLRIGYFIGGNSNYRLINCIADTIEPIDGSAEPSYSNGGIGFYILGKNIVLENCYVIIHQESPGNNRYPYYVTDTSPITGGGKYSLNINLLNCSCSVNGRNETFGILDNIKLLSNNVYLYNCFLENGKYLNNNILSNGTLFINDTSVPLKKENMFYFTVNKGNFFASYYKDGKSYQMGMDMFTTYRVIDAESINNLLNWCQETTLLRPFIGLDLREGVKPFIYHNQHFYYMDGTLMI